ncbi:copine-3 isoform X1, partial [Haematococcus lacustris]
MAIANVLKAYGRKAPHVTNHCFHLNGQADPVCLGIDAVCQAYRHALEVYELSGPTLFAPVIRMACNLAQQPHQTFNYLILLILTDGAIQDIEDTTDALVVASYLPMSVLIVGIGDADFQSMAFLDADDKVLRSTLGRPSERDVVQASGAVSAGSQRQARGMGSDITPSISSHQNHKKS